MNLKNTKNAKLLRKYTILTDNEYIWLGIKYHFENKGIYNFYYNKQKNLFETNHTFWGE